MPLLPIVVKLGGLRCVIIGGGLVAERKTRTLLEALCSDERRTDIVIISPTATGKLQEWAKEGRIEWLSREYEMNDTLGAALVFAATDSQEVNAQVRSEAERAGILVNAADDPDNSGFLLPAIVRRGRLLLAVSTAGASPSAARRIRAELEERYGQEYESWFDLLAEARLLIRRRVADTKSRQELHRELENWDAPRLIREGRIPPEGWHTLLLTALEQQPLLNVQAVKRLLNELEVRLTQSGMVE